MSAGALAAAPSPARAVLVVAAALGALVFGLPLAATVGLAGSAPGGFAPSGTAVADIPADRLVLYQEAAERYGLDWAVLAAVGKIECDHGRLELAGCNPRGSVNQAGATGPMQFLGSTWRRGTPAGSVPTVGPPTSTTADGFATDGDGDGIADVWNPADAIHAAARYLHTFGAPGDYRAALYAYNHADWYVDQVLDHATSYRGASTTALADAATVVGWAARYLGTPYVWGGNHGLSVEAMRHGAPSLQRAGDGRLGYFDCSSLVAWAYANTAGIDVGDTTWEQWAAGVANPLAERGSTIPPGGLRSGDLVFFHDISHVGIYLGADQFLHASHTGDNVKVSQFSTYGGFDGYVRYPLTGTDPAAPA